jgi:putative toxin-antitoxin system antitoxin component (TIGR02293 family)
MADILSMPVQTGRFKANPAKARPSGGRSLGLPVGNTAKVVQRVRMGFPYAALVHFQKTSGLPVGSIADLIRIPQRTLMRRKAKGRLSSEESERLLRLSGVFEKAVELFEGDTDAARRWLTTSNRELDNQSPLDFTRTEIGAREVEDLIGRLEYGVFT